MSIKKILTKYSIILLVYIIIVRFLKPYGFHLYYSIFADPDMMAESVRTIQSIFIIITFILNLILTIFIIVDSKQKKAVDWLIIAITLFSTETGIILFVMWQIYKELTKNQESQNNMETEAGEGKQETGDR